VIFFLPSLDEILAVRHPAFTDLLPGSQAIWKYSHADMLPQFKRPILRVGYSAGMPVNSAQNAMETTAWRAGSNYAVPWLAKLFPGANINDKEQTSIRECLPMLANPKYHSLSTSTAKQLSLWATSYLTLGIPEYPQMNLSDMGGNCGTGMEAIGSNS